MSKIGTRPGEVLLIIGVGSSPLRRYGIRPSIGTEVNPSIGTGVSPSGVVVDSIGTGVSPSVGVELSIVTGVSPSGDVVDSIGTAVCPSLMRIGTCPEDADGS